MLIIFLDLDGVLNNYYTQDTPGTMNRQFHIRVDPVNIEALEWLLQQTGASIVLSSSLRTGYTPDEWTQILRAVGVPSANVIGKTPVIDCWNGLIYVAHNRGDEIDTWLKQNGEPENFIILDDDGEMGIHSRRLVRTNYREGLTMERARRAIWMVKRNAPLYGKSLRVISAGSEFTPSEANTRGNGSCSDSQ